jgi:inosose dehydratase
LAPPSGDRDRDRLGGCDHAVEHLDGDGHLALDVLRRAREERWSFLDSVLNGVYTVPGDGAIDSVAAPEPLAEAGYSGWLICEAEQNPSKAHPLTYARRGYATLKATVEQVGLKLA